MPTAPAPTTRPPVRPAVAGGLSEIDRLRAELAQAHAKLAEKGPKVRKIQVSEKGGISLYGLGRFPVTLYVEGMEALLDAAPEIRAFIDANRSRLKKKED